MPDAWTTLVENSSLESGDAWEHLQAQQAGGGSYDTMVLADGLEVEMGNCEFDVEVGSNEVSVDIISADFEVEIEEVHYTIEVCDG